MCSLAQEPNLCVHPTILRLAQDPQKQKELTGLLGELPDERFADLVALGKHITDYSASAANGAANGGGGEDANGADMLDDDIGVAVEFEGDEEDEEDDGVDELVVRVRRPLPVLADFDGLVVLALLP